MSPLYLTGAERKVFEQLPEQLREGWKVMDETSEAYESPEALSIRAEIASFKKDPALKDYIEMLKEKNLDTIQLPDLQDESIADFFFAIGARGIAAFMDTLLLDIRNDEDIRGLAHLSTMRHTLLNINASISPA